MKKIIISLLVTAVSIPAFAHDALHTAAQTGDEKLNFSYSYHRMGMSDNYDDTDKVSKAAIFADGYMMAPDKMEMKTSNFTARYNPDDANSFHVSIPYHYKDMRMKTAMGMKMSMHSKGVGDVRVGGSHNMLAGSKENALKVHYGLSLPTGGVNKNDDGDRLGYMMQTGSGTWDPVVALSYDGNSGGFKYGAHAGAVLRFGENSQDYRFGNEYTASIYVGQQITPVIGATARLNGSSWGKIHGADSNMMPMMSPEQDGDFYGGEKLTAVLGVDFTAVEGILKGANLATEVGVPVYQNLNGPQMGEDYNFMIRLQKGI